MKKAMIGVFALLNLILVVCVVLYVMGMLPVNTAPVATTNAPMSTAPKSEVNFYLFEPPIVVNVQDGRKLRFMQIELQFMTRNEKALAHIESLEPLIRHELIMLYSTIDGTEIKEAAAKEKLRSDSLAIVNGLLETEGFGALVENIVFTKLIMQ